MKNLAPTGAVYQAGTLSGNPLAMAAGIVMLKTLKDNPGIYTELDRKAAKLAKGLKANLDKAGIKGQINRIGSMMTLFFNELPEITSFEDVMKSDKERYAKYFRLSLESGIYLAPSQFEASFISNAHTDEDIEKTIELSGIAMNSISFSKV